MNPLTFQGNLSKNRNQDTGDIGGAFGINQDVDPMMDINNISSGGNVNHINSINNANAQQQKAISSVGDILNNVLASTQKPEPLSDAFMNNPSGFQSPATAPISAPAPSLGNTGLQPAPQGAFGAPSSAGIPNSPNQGAFGAPTEQEMAQTNASGYPQGGLSMQDVGQSAQSTTNMQDISQAAQGAFQDPIGKLGAFVDTVARSVSEGDVPAMPQNDQEKVNLIQKMLTGAGMNFDVSGLADGSDQSKEMLKQGGALANALHGGSDAIKAQRAADPSSLDFLRREGWGEFLDQTENRRF